MDIHECHDRYGVSKKKLRLMQRDGVLNVSRDKTPKYWLQAVSDIQKGKLSARSIALVFRFPDKLEKLHHLTRTNRRVVDDHIKSVCLPGNELDLELRFTAPLGAVEKDPFLMGQFIAAIQTLIPSHDVDYYYLAVRVLLRCETDFQMNMMAESLRRAFSSIRDEPAMQGWWHTEDGHSVYHRPRYDL